MPEYTQEFYAQLESMIGQPCRGCRIREGEFHWKPNGYEKSKFKAVVRLCLVNPLGPPNKANNVGMYCTRCRKPGVEWRSPRKKKPSELPQLFDAKA